MTNHIRTKRRSQKGGAIWYNPITWFYSEDPYAPKKSMIDNISEGTKGFVNSAETFVGNTASSIGNTASSIGNTTTGAINSVFGTITGKTGMTNEQTGMTNEQTGMTTGGRRERRRRYGRTMKGGKGELGLTYYATPVSGLKVVEPTYWISAKGTTESYIKGGSRKRRGYKYKLRNSRRTRRHKI